MYFPEKLARIRSLISERDAIDVQLKELLGDTEAPKRGRPKKKGEAEAPPSLPLAQSSGGDSA